MKKILVFSLVLMFSFVFVGVASAAAPNWNVSGDWVFDYYYGGSNFHDMTLVQAPDGSLTGSGGAFSGIEPYAYPWTIVSGLVDGDTITITADYDDLDCFFTLTGTIVAGTMSGTWIDDCGSARAGTWETTSGEATAVTDTTLVIKTGDMQGWGFLEETATGSGSMAFGPGTPPAGDGSANLVVDNLGGVLIGKAGYTGTRLDEITELGYSTYRTSGGSALAIALQFNFDGDVTDVNEAWQGRLVYEPYHTQAVNSGVWETWDAMDDTAGTGTGNWWFSNGTHATNSGCTMATPCTWAEVLAAFPDGGVHNTLGGVVLKAGGGWTGGFDGNVDALTIGVNWANTTYDFEPVADTDADNDGVQDGDDLCDSTGDDTDWDETWGPNRWQVQDDVWYQNKVKKGTPTPTASSYGIDYTYGCNGHDILTMLNDELGSVMNGHWKFGISSGLLQEFHDDLADGVLDGMYFIETVTVPADDVDGVSSVTSLLVGENYVFKASGVANAGDNIQFDADYSFRTPTSTTWTDDVNTYEYLGNTLLDLMVNSGFVNWDDDATYNLDHTYWYDYFGTGAPVSLQVFDTYYPGNTGNLTVDIYADL